MKRKSEKGKRLRVVMICIKLRQLGISNQEKHLKSFWDKQGRGFQVFHAFHLGMALRMAMAAFILKIEGLASATLY